MIFACAHQVGKTAHGSRATRCLLPLLQAEILQTLSEVDKQGKYIVLMHKYFHFQDHFCIVTELLGPRYL